MNASEQAKSRKPRRKPEPPPAEYVRAAKLAARLGVGVVTLWVWRRKGLIPPPVQLGPNVVAWEEATIRAWMASRRPVGGVPSEAA